MQRNEHPGIEPGSSATVGIIPPKKGNCFRMKHLYVLIVCTILPWNNTCFAQAPDSAKIVKSLVKCWRALSHEYSTIYGLEEDEVARYSKQKICFSTDSIVLYNGPLYTPKYAVKKVNAEDFAKNNFDVSKERLGILKDSVFEITISTLTKPSPKGIVHKMTDIIAYDGTCIYVVNDGVIFKLYDSEAKKEARGSN